MNTLADADSTAKKGRFWALVPVGLLGLTLVGWAVMITIAVDDPGFAVEPNYYQKALHWDAQQAQHAENERLGWRVDLAQVSRSSSGRNATFVVRVHDHGGRSISGARISVEAFFNARAAHRISAKLTEVGNGSYRLEMPIQEPGLWEFRLAVRKGPTLFTDVVRHDVSLPER